MSDLIAHHVEVSTSTQPEPTLSHIGPTRLLPQCYSYICLNVIFTYSHTGQEGTELTSGKPHIDGFRFVMPHA